MKDLIILTVIVQGLAIFTDWMWLLMFLVSVLLMVQLVSMANQMAMNEIGKYFNVCFVKILIII